MTGQNQSTQKNALPRANLPKIPYEMAWDWTSASTLQDRQLTASAMA